MSEEIKLDLSDRFFEKDGEYFIQSREYKGKDGHKLIFEKVDKKTYDEFLRKLAKKLIKKSGIKIEQVIYEALKYVPKKDLKKIERDINKPKPATVSAKKGCLMLTVGKQEIQIVG
jgi:hypothetical protein